ncbi:MAG: NADH-quinone oxidoreductase subunit M, partial [Propionibacteriaceae bacterium]|nr:NADH-quinone oxidoreductase subunit M [Propionibacteriaceae bacterium]
AALSALSLPGMSTFVSEFLVLAGTWSRDPIVTVVALLGVVMAAAYALRLYRVPMTGPLTDEAGAAFTGRDLNGLERGVMVPIIAIILLLGFVPSLAVNLVEPTAVTTMQHLGMTDPAPVVEGVAR